MLSNDTILKKIEENRKIIREYGIKRIGLFGSYVRSEQKHGSDIDVLVEFEEGEKTFDNYMDLKFFLEELFGCNVDLVIAEAVKPRLKSYILENVRYAEGL